MCTENFVKLGHVACEKCERKGKQTDRQTDEQVDTLITTLCTPTGPVMELSYHKSHLTSKDLISSEPVAL